MYSIFVIKGIEIINSRKNDIFEAEQEILKNLAIIVPDNITDIVGFLEREIAKIETPIIAHNQQISLLQERKQIIINDVVTGKVKVS